jgi:mycofactocin precursor
MPDTTVASGHLTEQDLEQDEIEHDDVEEVSIDRMCGVC